MKKLSFVALALALAILPAKAQQVSNGRTTTAAPTYSNNTANPLSLDTSGNLRIICMSGCAGAGGTQDVNLKNYNGSAVGASNAQYVQPGTGATWAATQSGSWNVGITGTLPAFAAIPTFKIDQTTPGVTNGVQVNAALPAGTALIGKVGIDQTTPGTTNGTQDAATGSTGSAVPSKAIYVGANSAANLTGLIQASSSAAISVSTATTTQLVALSGSTKIYVTSFDVIAAGTGNIKFVYGTGSSCGTGTTDLTGNYNLTAQAGIAKGSGLGPVLVVPAGNALCVTTSAAVGMYGSVAYTQF